MKPLRVAGRSGTFYVIDDVPLRRVSDLLSQIRTPQLENWYARLAAEAVLEGATVADAVAAPNRERDRRARRGTSVHEAIAQEVPDEALEIGDERIGFLIAVARAQGRLIGEHYGTELTVANPALGYAGTADLIARQVESPGGWAVFDWKTGSTSRSYVKHALQLAAYALATHYVDGDELVPIDVSIEWGWIVGLRADRTFEAHRVPVNGKNEVGGLLRAAVRGLAEIARLRDVWGTSGLWDARIRAEKE